MDPIEAYIDLHTHSTESDGMLSPEALMELAAQQQVAAIALTDHDTVSGLPAARRAADRLGIELVPGIELSTDYCGTEVHILGYYIEEANAAFLGKVQEFCDAREERNKKMVLRLQEEGFDFTYEELRAAFPDSVLTRAHFARFLADRGYVRNMDAAFRQYIGNSCRCYVPRERITPMEAVSLIHERGGLAFFAHPMLCSMGTDSLEALVASLKDHGLDGLEGIYSTYTARQERIVGDLAEKYALLISGGSDFHGSNKPDIRLGVGRGHLRIPYCCLQRIKDQKALLS